MPIHGILGTLVLNFLPFSFKSYLATWLWISSPLERLKSSQILLTLWNPNHWGRVVAASPGIYFSPFFFTILKLRTLSLISHISVHPEQTCISSLQVPSFYNKNVPNSSADALLIVGQDSLFHGKTFFFFFFVFYFCWCLVLSVLLPRLIFISCDFMFLGDLCYQWQMIIFSK